MNHERMSKSEDVRFLDSGSLNDISFGEWFWELRKLEKLGYLDLGGDSTHPIEHIGDIPTVW